MFMRALLDIPHSGEGNYRCDRQRRVQQVRYTTGTPDHLLRLPKQVLMRGFDSMAPAGGRTIPAYIIWQRMKRSCRHSRATHGYCTADYVSSFHSPGLLLWKEDTYDVRI